MGRLRGRTVSVALRDGTDRDSFGNEIESYAEPVDVANVLVARGACEDLDSSRPEGVRVALTLHFPKTWTGRLRGAKVTLTGEYAGSYSVIGDPMPYQAELCPGDWNMPVEVEAVDG
jgi:hypothetical protein